MAGMCSLYRSFFVRSGEIFQPNSFHNDKSTPLPLGGGGRVGVLSGLPEITLIG